ncbi:hypothetical protein SUGI_1075930 [Cryptomeria japonica]|nr:hypothetical protein SUGI_1075930 [Cryptomeria japonica]
MLVLGDGPGESFMASVILVQGLILFWIPCFGSSDKWRVERKLDLVHGRGSVGLMGLISQAVHDGGRQDICRCSW